MQRAGIVGVVVEVRGSGAGTSGGGENGEHRVINGRDCIRTEREGVERGQGGRELKPHAVREAGLVIEHVGPVPKQQRRIAVRRGIGDVDHWSPVRERAAAGNGHGRGTGVIRGQGSGGLQGSAQQQHRQRIRGGTEEDGKG